MMTKGFVANGANVYICSRKEAVCQKAAQELTKIGPGKCVSLSSYDLSKGKSECAKIIEELKSLGFFLFLFFFFFSSPFFLPLFLIFLSFLFLPLFFFPPFFPSPPLFSLLKESILSMS